MRAHKEISLYKGKIKTKRMTETQDMCKNRNTFIHKQAPSLNGNLSEAEKFSH